MPSTMASYLLLLGLRMMVRLMCMVLLLLVQGRLLSYSSMLLRLHMGDLFCRDMHRIMHCELLLKEIQLIL